MRVSATIDHKIRLSTEDISSPMLAMLKDALSIPNLEKLQAQKNKVWGWQNMPDHIALYEEAISGGERTLIIPRGFQQNLIDGLKTYGIEIEWLDSRRWHPTFRIGNQPEPRAWQEPAVEAILGHEQGMYKAPSGSGKTVVVLKAIRRLACKSLVIVNTKDIVWQWRERIEQHLGPDYPVGQIGDGIFDVSPYLTIATAQTLHSRYAELEQAGFFDEFSFVCLDECHHAQASTFRRLLDRFSARYRIGVSATPDKTGDFALALNVLGPIFHTTYPKDVPDLMVPEVVRIPTRFGFGFRGASYGRRSNYPQMMAALIASRDRNELIVACIMENVGHHQLVISRRLEHLDTLHDMLDDAGFRDPIMQLTGQDDNDARLEAKAMIESRPSVVLSTLADEAMDIPRLDRIHLTFPQKNPGLVVQQVGRVERVHEDKTSAIIFDYADMNVGPCEKQWRTRRFEVYEPRGYKITTRRADSFNINQARML